MNKKSSTRHSAGTTTTTSSCNTDQTLESLFSDDIPDENTAPSETDSELIVSSLNNEQQQQQQSLSKDKPLKSNDDDISLSINIFDDGPELSELSADES